MQQKDSDRPAAAAPAATEATSAPPSLGIDGAVAVLRLNRPRQHNRIEPDDLVVMRGHLKTIEAAADVRVLVVRATGKSFSAGYHLGAVGGSRSGDAADGQSAFESFINQLENLAVPTICALQGSVYGGATDLALACDFRLGVTGMQMFMPAARMGLHYYPSGLQRYVTRLGLAAAKRLFLTGAAIDAAEMLRIGFLDELVPAAELSGRVEALVALLADNAPLAVRGMKRALNQIARNDLDLPATRAAIAATLASADIKEGLAAVAERRKPLFHGR